jgi:hypothetical protein
MSLSIFSQKGSLQRSSEAFTIRSYEPSRAVAFMHIPKTSGSALTAGLVDALAPRRSLFGLDRSHFGKFNSFDSMSPETKRIIHLELDDLPEQMDLIAGHFAFSTLSEKYPEAQLVTFLREPYSRLSSHWLFLRSLSEDELAVWGNWGKIALTSRKPLANFLSNRALACNLDNVCVRMLLWPHPLIPIDDFIDARDDDSLVSAAAVRLQQFAYTDVVENPLFESNLQAWVGRELDYAKVNETAGIPPERCTPLHQEFTADALALMDSHSRLDTRLWMALAQQRVTAGGAQTLQRHTMMRSTARYAWLMMREASSGPRPRTHA